MRPGDLLRPLPDIGWSSLDIGNRPDVGSDDYEVIGICPLDGCMLFLGEVDYGWHMLRVMHDGVVGWVTAEKVEVVTKES